MFGLTFEKLLIIGVLAAFLIGPERLPLLAEAASRLLRQFAQFTQSAKERLDAEFEEDIDWRSLDPRQYDPRRIIRESLGDLLDPPAEAAQPLHEVAANPDVASHTRRNGRGLRDVSTDAQRDP